MVGELYRRKFKNQTHGKIESVCGLCKSCCELPFLFCWPYHRDWKLTGVVWPPHTPAHDRPRSFSGGVSGRGGQWQRHSLRSCGSPPSAHRHLTSTHPSLHFSPSVSHTHCWARFNSPTWTTRSKANANVVIHVAREAFVVWAAKVRQEGWKGRRWRRNI